MKKNLNYCVILHFTVAVAEDETPVVNGFTVLPYEKSKFLLQIWNKGKRPQLRGYDDRKTAHAAGRSWIGKSYQEEPEQPAAAEPNQ